VSAQPSHVPSHLQDQGDKEHVAPPAPKCPRVKLTDYPETEVYVLPFSFYAFGLR